MKPPEVKSSISGYTFDFAEEKLVVQVRRIRNHTDRITGDIKLILGKAKIQEPTFNFNFSSATTRKNLVRQLSEKYAEWKPETWLAVIDEVTRQVQTHSQAGEDWSLIRPTVSGIKHPGYYLEPVVMKGVPNVIYGDKGTNKTTLALTMLGLITLGLHDNETGLSASTAAKCVLLDWENDATLTDYTLSRLVHGQTLPYFELPYLRCQHPLADDIDRIANFLQQNQAKVILIDSLGQAAGSERFDSAGKGVAIRFFEALRAINLTSLIIGQNAKDDTGKKSIFGSTYFTYYTRNIFRLQAAKEQVSRDEMSVVLIHEEANFSRKYPPIGLHLTYTDTTIKIDHEEANLSQFLNRVSLTKDLLDFLSTGAKSVRSIADELSISDNRVRVMLSQLKKRSKVTNLGSGMWGLLAPQEEY